MKKDGIKISYFDVKHSLEVHDVILEKSGGRKGIINQGYLESILHHIQNDGYYPEFLDKITHLCFSVNKLHSFIDGNKRTSIALSAYFLKVNGYEHCIIHFIREMENISVWIAENKIKKALLKNIIEDIIMLEDREETKLAIFLAISATDKSFKTKPQSDNKINDIIIDIVNGQYKNKTIQKKKKA